MLVTLVAQDGLKQMGIDAQAATGGQHDKIIMIAILRRHLKSTPSHTESYLARGRPAKGGEITSQSSEIGVMPGLNSAIDGCWRNFHDVGQQFLISGLFNRKVCKRRQNGQRITLPPGP